MTSAASRAAPEARCGPSSKASPPSYRGAVETFPATASEMHRHSGVRYVPLSDAEPSALAFVALTDARRQGGVLERFHRIARMITDLHLALNPEEYVSDQARTEPAVRRMRFRIPAPASPDPPNLVYPEETVEVQELSGVDFSPHVCASGRDGIEGLAGGDYPNTPCRGTTGASHTQRPASSPSGGPRS